MLNGLFHDDLVALEMGLDREDAGGLVQALDPAVRAAADVLPGSWERWERWRGEGYVVAVAHL